ncbi:phosphotransferase family protein [Actinoplanes sp. NBRC 103695]|uniref:phosphotransferase family protein n=1 Tax=Actinoplanes sp. NBRC 103695 TaxID=3032202 RepID=UPI0024A15A81|nr:phosphotransferase family protein [Actinoplanes sp. NBRC 103695]GLY95716.1 acyl-CoA dehydrogenase [Actinoplanes sp. NBRC 103695]
MKGLDLDALRAHLKTGPLTATMFAGGRSNLTYAVTDGDQRWVLRRPPLGHVLPTAHDMSREHKVLSALSAAGFPAPAPVLLCTDPDVIGAPFYLMEHATGRIYRDVADLEALGAERMRALTLHLVDTLADLHALDPEAIGLGDFGRPQGFNERQVRRWKKQLDASRSRDVAGIDELHARLAVHVPEGDGAVVHGDFRLDNVLIADDLTVSAVLDWEMSTLGDPLSDVALMQVYAGRPLLDKNGEPRSPLTVPGHPTLPELAARYAERSKRDVSDLHWYIAFACFKLAVILEGVHFRYVHGQTVGAGFETVGRMVAPLVTQGHEALEG